MNEEDWRNLALMVIAAVLAAGSILLAVWPASRRLSGAGSFLLTMVACFVIAGALVIWVIATVRQLSPP